MKILVINAGSSSLKYQLIDMEDKSIQAKGLCERIGIDGHIKHTPLVSDKPVFEAEIPMPTHAEAIEVVLEKLVSPEYGVVKSMSEIAAVGHRVLHGGKEFAKSVYIDNACMAAIERCIPLGPLHNPANIMGIEACRKVMGDKVPMVAVFDTAFHMTMPPKAYTYAIPYEYTEKDNLRRYGFHGTSHRFVSERALEIMGIMDDPNSKVIVCHLGNGSSISAVKGGKCVDTSMGLSPLVGLPMGTRCGDIDPTVLQFIMNKYGMSMNEIMTTMNKKSGVLGISGVSSDFRDLGKSANEGNERSQLALDMFHYWVAKVVGSYVAAMNGVDGIAFTGGIGENGCDSRAAICEYLTYLGVKIDADANKIRSKTTTISTAESKVKVMVIPTNEELVIARDTKSIVEAMK